MKLLLFVILSAKFADCYDECHGEYCPPPIPKSKQLTFGSTYGPLIGRDPKTGCYCREKIEQFALCYGRNHCTAMTQDLPLRSEALKITNTHIKVLGPVDFHKLRHLVELQIDSNYDLERILNGTFKYLNNLVNLSIYFNVNLNVIEKDAFVGLTKLKQLFLNNNGFENLYEITYSLSPQVVPNLSTLIIDSNSFIQINENDFKTMTNSMLEELSLNLCRIEYIHPKAMIPLKNLQKLHLGENTINGTVLTAMLTNMVKANIDLKTLNLFYMGFRKRPPKPMMEVIAISNISSINLSKNHFEVIDRDSFPLMPNIMTLDIRDVLALQITDEAFANLPNLRTLLISGNRLSEIPKGVLSLGNLTFLDLQENSPGNSFHSYFRIKEIDFSHMTKLLYLNLGFNGFAHLFDTSFKGLTSLKTLILKNSSVFHIERRTFAMFSELTTLNLMNNVMVHGDAVPDVFFNLTKLETLILSNCRFKYITSEQSAINPFRNLKSLKYLFLDKNLIKTIAAAEFQFLVSLVKLDLSYNLLNSWEQSIFASNKNLTRLILSKNKLTDLTVEMLEDFAKISSVDLDQNAILCKCLGTYDSYKKWLDNKNMIFNESIFDPPIYCGYPDQLNNITIVDFLTKSQYGEHICSFRIGRIFFLLPFICIVFIFGVLGILAFWYRWHIKYWIFLAKLYLSRRGKIRAPLQKRSYTNYEFDAFVSYSTEDRDFVIKLVNMIENYEPYHKLCVYERDFQIGTIISESVLESVAKSRKTLLIISDNYAKSQWCRWETQICEHHRLFFENEHGEYVDDSLILIKLSSISDTYLTPTLKYLLKTRIYLQWSLDERKQEAFWDKLRNTLGPPLKSKSEVS